MVNIGDIEFDVNADFDERQLQAEATTAVRQAERATPTLKIDTEIRKGVIQSELKKAQKELAKRDLAVMLDPELNNAEFQRETARIRTLVRRLDVTLDVETDIKTPRPTALNRVANLFRKAGIDAGDSFNLGFGQSFRAQVFSDPQAAVLKLTAAFAGLVAVVTPLGPLLVGLAASAAAFAGIIGALGVAAGVAAIGMNGFFGAVKSGGDELKNLTPSARESAESLRSLGDEWSTLRKAVQESIFRQVGDSFSRLDRTIRQGLQPGMERIGSSIGKIIDSFADWASSEPGIALISSVMNRIADVVERMRPGIQAFGIGLLRLFDAALPAAGDMADTFSEIGESFAEWTDSLDDGKINRVSQAIAIMASGFKTLGTVFGPVLEGLGNALDDVGPSIDSLRKALLPILQTVGEDLGDALTLLGPVVAGLVDSFSKFLKAVQPLAPILLPLLGAILAFTAGGPVGVILALSLAFASLAAKSKPLREGFASLFKAVKPVIDQGLKQMEPLVKDLMKAFGELGTALGPIAKVLLRSFGPVIAGQVKFFFGLIGQVLRIVTRMVRFVAALLRGDWTKAWRVGLSLAKIFNPFHRLIDGIVRAVVATVRNTILQFNRLRYAAGQIWDAITNRIGNARDRMLRIFSSIRTAVGRVPGAFRSAASAVGRAWDNIISAVRTPLREVRNNALVPFLKAIDKIPGVPNYWSRIPSFATGGWTGPGGKYKPAGVVHADEYVVSKSARRRLEKQAPGALDYMNRTGRWPEGEAAFRRATRRARDGYARGGRVYPVQSRTMGRGYPGHTGVDFPVPTGTKVMSAVNGLVTAVRHLTYSYGKHIRVKGEGVETIYAHLSSTLAKVGQSVTAGQIIGLSGSTGNSTGPHLHFEVRPPGTQAGTAAWLAGAESVSPHKGFDIPNPKDFLNKLGTSGFLNSRTFFSSLGKDVLSGLRKQFDIFDFLFDSGGIANGKGIMHKQTLEPERVLSPAQTRAFQQMVDANFGQGSAGAPGLSLEMLGALLNNIQIVVQPGMDRRATAELWLNGKKFAEALA